jgi:hypothetical protein
MPFNWNRLFPNSYPRKRIYFHRSSHGRGRTTMNENQGQASSPTTSILQEAGLRSECHWYQESVEEFDRDTQRYHELLP